MKSDPRETNSTIVNRQRRKLLRCDRCPPHGGENKTRSKRGVRKRKYKDHR